jgi:hypothetical protein
MVEILSDTRNTDEIEHAAYEAVSEAVQLDIKIAEAEAVAVGSHRSPRTRRGHPRPLRPGH